MKETPKNTKKKSIFNENAYMYLLTKLRVKLKEEDIKVSAKYKERGLSLKFTRNFMHEKGEVEMELDFKKYSDITLNMEFYPGLLYLDKKGEEIYTVIFEYIKKLAIKMGVNNIITEHKFGFNKRRENFFKKYGFVAIRDLIPEGYPTTIVGSTEDWDAEDHYVFEVKTKAAEQRLESYNAFRDAIEKLKTKFDATFKVKSVMAGISHLESTFYYEGLEGQIITNYISPYAIYLYQGDDSFKKEEDILGSVGVLKEEELFNSIKTLIEEEIEERGFERLTAPPKKYFKEFCNKHIGLGGDITDKVFNLLCAEMHPKDIELKILNESEASTHSYDEFFLFNLLGRYFVCNFNTKDVFMYEEITQAIEFFEQSCKQKEEKIYQDKLSKIQEVKDKMQESFIVNN